MFVDIYSEATFVRYELKKRAYLRRNVLLVSVEIYLNCLDYVHKVVILE